MDRAQAAIVGGIGMMVVFGTIGYLLKRIIWDPKKSAKDAIEQGRKVASNAIFYAAMASAFFFKIPWISGDDYYNPSNIYIEAALRMLVVVTIWTFIGFVLGFLYWNIVKQKNWKPIWYAVGALIAIALLRGQEEFGAEDIGDDMHFSMKYAILFIAAGFVAYAYYLKEGESAKIVAIGGLVLCAIFTWSTYGISYAMLTSIEYAVGCGLAGVFMKRKIE